MAAFLPHLVTCPCGTTFVVDAAESVNVRRLPQLRDDILASRLHRARCPGCAVESTVEKDFLYADPDRNFYCKVQPRGDRYQWAQEAETLDKGVARMPEGMSPSAARTLRVAFGMDELREKILAQDAGLDDRIVELLKVFLLHEHPVLLNRPRLRLRLDEQSPEQLAFVAAYEHDPHRFRLHLPRDVAQSVARRRDEMKKWLVQAHGTDTLFAPGAQWTSLWKWSPQTPALCALKALREQIRHQDVDLRTTQVTLVLEHIPRGSHLPDWAKNDLAFLLRRCQDKGWEKVERTIFDVRFDAKLANDWTTNRNRKDIATLFQLFEKLPSNNVEGNAKINEIDYGRGSVSTYDPKSHDIFIKSADARRKSDFAATVRHEVGHAVHERKKPLVDAWLKKRFKWQTFDATNNDEIEKWVELMGGWHGIDSAQRADVRRQLKHAVGSNPGTWTGAKPALLAPQSHPCNQPEFGPRLALEGSSDPVQNRYWYDCYKTWYRHGRLRFCCNFWYAQLMAVSADTLGIVTRMNSSYAAMSPPEFFAEMYAAYYDSNPARRKAFPADVHDWFSNFVEERAAASPRR
jgi:hypothetical protein